MSVISSQDKHKEIAFFDSHAAESAYDVFTPESNLRLFNACIRLMKPERGARVVAEPGAANETARL